MSGGKLEKGKRAVLSITAQNRRGRRGYTSAVLFEAAKGGERMGCSVQTCRAYEEILAEELVPAMGCTEPIAIAYAGALARETLSALHSNWNSRSATISSRMQKVLLCRIRVALRDCAQL